MFAVGYTIECFTAADAGSTYQKLGSSENCANGVGKYGALHVYQISQYECPGNFGNNFNC